MRLRDFWCLEFALLAALLVGLFSWAARADVTFTVGIGKAVLEKQSFERDLSVGYTFRPLASLYVKPEIGYLLAQGPGRKNSAYGSLIVGMRVTTPVGIYAFAGVGPTYLVSPDNLVLSGHLQYNLQWGACFEDKWGALCGKVKHLSNCHGCPVIGGPEPNIGVDLGCFEAVFNIF
jgi:hypothetical protein